MNNSTASYLPPYKQSLPWLAGMALFMQSLDGTILNTALPSIARELSLSPLSMQSVIVSYGLTLALLIPLSGWLADRFGTRNIFVIAVVIFVLGSMLCGFSNTLPELIASRIVQAIGGSMMVPVARLALLYTYPKAQLLDVLSFITIPGLIGPVIGPSLGGWIVELASWHWIFFINLPIGLIGVFMAQRFMPNIQAPVGTFDLIGLFLFSGGLVMVTLGLETGVHNITNDRWFLVIMVVAVLILFMYYRHTKRVEKPLIDLNLLKIRTLRVGIAANLLTRLGIGGMPFLLPLMFQVDFGFSASKAGMLLIPSALATVFSKPILLPIVRKYGYKKVLLGNTLILSLVISTFSLLKVDTPIAIICSLLVLYGSVNSIQMSTMNTISMADLDNTNASGGNSLIAVMQQLSMSLGVSIAGLVLSIYTKSEIMTQMRMDLSFKYTFLTLGAITAFSSLLFLRLQAEDGNTMSGHTETPAH